LNDCVKNVEQEVTRLLPDTQVRKLCLSVMLESLNEANLYGAQKWGVYFRNDIGHCDYLEYHRNHIWNRNSGVSCSARLDCLKHFWIYDLAFF